MKLTMTQHETESDKINIRLDCLVIAIFAIPFIAPSFMVLPEWYITLEIVTGFIVIGFCAIGIGVLAMGLALDQHPKVKLPYFTLKRYLAWGIGALILTSMFVQGMTNLFSVYLIALLAFNVLSYTWMNTPIDK